MGGSGIGCCRTEDSSARRERALERKGETHIVQDELAREHEAVPRSRRGRAVVVHDERQVDEDAVRAVGD